MLQKIVLMTSGNIILEQKISFQLCTDISGKAASWTKLRIVLPNGNSILNQKRFLPTLYRRKWINEP